MTNKHTPGTWELGEFDEHLGYGCMTAGVRAGPAVLDGSDYGQGRCADISAESKTRMMNDARLIAAAPDLLAALQALNELAVAHFDDFNGVQSSILGIMDKARNAIDKATGEC